MEGNGGIRGPSVKEDRCMLYDKRTKCIDIENKVRIVFFLFGHIAYRMSMLKYMIFYKIQLAQDFCKKP